MRLPYEGQTSVLPAQAHIQQFLEFLGAGDVQFSVNAALSCTVQWCQQGEEDSMTLSAQGYVEQWMRSRVWERRQPAAGPLAGEQERALAVDNFWYVMRDQVLAQAAEQMFNQDRLFKAARQQSQTLLRRLRGGDTA